MNEWLPPISDRLDLYIQQANDQTLVWRRALQPKQAIPDPTGHGWKERDENQMLVQPTMMNKDQTPKGLAELIACHCAKSACHQSDCICRVNELSCKDFCTCKGVDCENPRNHQDYDDEDNDAD